MGNAVADSVSDPNNDKRFRLLQDEEGAPSPNPKPKGTGQPPAKPPKAPPLAAVPSPDPKQPNPMETRIKELEQENEQLVGAIYYLQQQIKELRDSK